MIILKVTKNQGFNVSLENLFFKNPSGEQIHHPSVLGLIFATKNIILILSYQMMYNFSLRII